MKHAQKLALLHTRNETMQSTKQTHIITIMKLLIKGEAVSSIDQLASNSNQYFSKIKKNGIALVEVWEPNRTNTGRHKERSLHQDPENIKRAKEYLDGLQKI